MVKIWRELDYDPKVYNTKSSFRIDVNNKDLSNEFKNYKSNEKWNIPKKINISYYIAGLWDIDGSVFCYEGKYYLRIIITQKDNNNLLKVYELLKKIGINPKYYKKEKLYKDKPYPIEIILVSSQKQMEIFCKTIPLKHPTKLNNSNRIYKYIMTVNSRISNKKQIINFLKEPKTRKEIKEHFNFTENQLRWAMSNVLKDKTIKIIPIKYYKNEGNNVP